MTRPVALVTGARQGIGAAIASALAAAGYDLALYDRGDVTDTGAACAAAGAATLSLTGDLADVAHHDAILDAATARFGRLDVLVNNAGIGAVTRGDMLELRPENFDLVMGVNLRGTMFLTHAAARRMLAHRDQGAVRAIVTLTSVSAEMANPERVEYCVSKAAAAMWIKALAVRLAPQDIGVFEIRPGVIRTGMTAPVADRYDRLIGEGGLVPAGRWGEPQDVAEAVLAVLRPGLRFATGSVIHVDGGLAVPRF